MKKCSMLFILLVMVNLRTFANLSYPSLVLNCSIEYCNLHSLKLGYTSDFVDCNQAEVKRQIDSYFFWQIAYWKARSLNAKREFETIYLPEISPDFVSVASANISKIKSKAYSQTSNLSVDLTAKAPWSLIVGDTSFTTNSKTFNKEENASFSTTNNLTSVENSIRYGTVNANVEDAIDSDCNISTPVFNGNPSVCGPGYSWQLSVTGCPDGTFNWYNVPTGGTSLSFNSYFNTPIITKTTNYYVDCTIGSCTSARKTITITYYPETPPPTVSQVTINNGQAANLTATNCIGGTLKWYNTSINGTLLFKGDNFLTPKLTSPTVYYASCKMGFCDSPRTKASVNISCTSMVTTKSGNWNDPSVWSCGRIPTSEDNITIKANHNIHLTPSQTGYCKFINVELNSVLNIPTGAKFHINPN